MTLVLEKISLLLYENIIITLEKGRIIYKFFP